MLVFRWVVFGDCGLRGTFHVGGLSHNFLTPETFHSYHAVRMALRCGVGFVFHALTFWHSFLNLCRLFDFAWVFCARLLNVNFSMCWRKLRASRCGGTRWKPVGAFAMVFVMADR